MRFDKRVTSLSARSAFTFNLSLDACAATLRPLTYALNVAEPLKQLWSGTPFVNSAIQSLRPRRSLRTHASGPGRHARDVQDRSIICVEQ